MQQMSDLNREEKDAVGTAALARLCAPLPAGSQWRQALRQVIALGIKAVELLPGWVQGLPERDGIADMAAKLIQLGIRPAIADLPADPPLGSAALPPVLATLARWGVGAVLLPPEPEGMDDADRPRYYRQLAGMASDANVTLLLQNRASGWPEDGASLGGLLAAVNQSSLGACFDPAAFVARKRHPFLSEFLPGPLKRYIHCLRLRDALFEDGSEVAPGQGNAELQELVSALEARGYRGWYCLALPAGQPYAAGLAQAQQAAAAIMAML